MIARNHRFHGHNSLRYVYSHGQVVRGPLFALKYTNNPKRTDYRLAVVVSKKVYKSAVKRNRIRRRLYESFRKQAADKVPAYDIVLTVFSPDLTTIPAEQLDRALMAQLYQAGIINK